MNEERGTMNCERSPFNFQLLTSSFPGLLVSVSLW